MTIEKPAQVDKTGPARSGRPDDRLRAVPAKTTELSGPFAELPKPEVLSSGFSRNDAIADQNL
jgi:hypothetical protein